MNGSKVRKARIDLGLTQEQMAAKLKVGYSTYRTWEQSFKLTDRQESNFTSRLAALKLKGE